MFNLITIISYFISSTIDWYIVLIDLSHRYIIYAMAIPVESSTALRAVANVLQRELVEVSINLQMCMVLSIIGKSWYPNPAPINALYMAIAKNTASNPTFGLLQEYVLIDVILFYKSLNYLMKYQFYWVIFDVNITHETSKVITIVRVWFILIPDNYVAMWHFIRRGNNFNFNASRLRVSFYLLSFSFDRTFPLASRLEGMF